VAEDRPIIIKRIKKSGGAHHGGAWKVAYADFVTAMMAFFLLLWLLNAVTEEQRQGIAQYFKPTIAPQNQQSQEAILNGQPAVMMAVDGASAAQAQVDIEDAEEDAEDEPKSASDTDNETETEAVPSEEQKAEKPVDVKEAAEVVAKAEQQQFEDVKKKIEQQIQQDPGLADLKNNIDIQQTPEGLRIQLLGQRLDERAQPAAAVARGACRGAARQQALDLRPYRCDALSRPRRLQQLGAFDRSRQRRAPRAGDQRRRRQADRECLRSRRHRSEDQG
jgi:chemotaxis protein MotB